MGKRTRTPCLMTRGYILKFGIVFPSKSCFSQCWGDSIHLSVSHRVDWHRDHCRSSTKTTTTWRQQPNHGQTFWYPATRVTRTALFMAQLRHVRPRLSFSGTRNTDETAPPCSTSPFFHCRAYMECALPIATIASDAPGSRFWPHLLCQYMYMAMDGYGSIIDLNI